MGVVIQGGEDLDGFNCCRHVGTAGGFVLFVLNDSKQRKIRLTLLSDPYSSAKTNTRVTKTREK